MPIFSLKSPYLVIFFNESLPSHHYSALVVYIKVIRYPNGCSSNRHWSTVTNEHVLRRVMSACEVSTAAHRCSWRKRKAGLSRSPELVSPKSTHQSCLLLSKATVVVGRWLMNSYIVSVWVLTLRESHGSMHSTWGIRWWNIKILKYDIQNHEINTTNDPGKVRWQAGATVKSVVQGIILQNEFVSWPSLLVHTEWLQMVHLVPTILSNAYLRLSFLLELRIRQMLILYAVRLRGYEIL